MSAPKAALDQVVQRIILFVQAQTVRPIYRTLNVGRDVRDARCSGSQFLYLSQGNVLCFTGSNNWIWQDLDREKPGIGEQANSLDGGVALGRAHKFCSDRRRQGSERMSMIMCDDDPANTDRQRSR